MTRISRSSKSNILYFALLGIGLFIILYVLSALNYPGGSWNFTKHDGFSFWHNYLCDLLDDYAINGEVNTARFFARAALGVLCASLILIWYMLPQLFDRKSVNLSLMKFSGILSFIITLFLASGTHDVIVRIAGVFGALAVFTCLIELYKIKQYMIFYLGAFCLLIFFTNYYIYETGQYINTLPVIQKLTFISFISWFIWLDILLIRKLKHLSLTENMCNDTN